MTATSRALWFCLVTRWWCDGWAAVDGILWWLCMFAQRTLLMVMCCFLFRHAGGEGCCHQRSVDGVHVHGAPTACVLWGGETSPAAADWCRAGQGKDWVEMPTNWKTSILTGENRLDQNSLDSVHHDEGIFCLFFGCDSLCTQNPLRPMPLWGGGGGGDFVLFSFQPLQTLKKRCAVTYTNKYDYLFQHFTTNTILLSVSVLKH